MTARNHNRNYTTLTDAILGRPERNQDRSNLAAIIDWPSRRVVC